MCLPDKFTPSTEPFVSRFLNWLRKRISRESGLSFKIALCLCCESSCEELWKIRPSIH